MFRYAIFDFDGTLADTGAGVFASVQYALRRMGRPVPEAAALIDRLWDSPELEEEKP